MTDALKDFDFNKVGGGNNLYLKFEADRPVKLRVLTTDPVVYMDKFANTRFAFTVWNFTEGKAQILQATSTMARKIGELHVDPDFGANIKNIDVKITPTGQLLERRYDIQVLTTSETLSSEQISEAQKINLDEKIGKNSSLAQRMSFYDPAAFEVKSENENVNEIPREVGSKKDIEVEDIGDELIDLDSIPF